MIERGDASREIPPFDRTFFESGEAFTRIGGGSIGGKAHGLVFIRDILEGDLEPGAFPSVRVNIPTLTVVGADVFEAFMQRNGLEEIAFSDAPDERIAHAFQRADLPTEVLGDLKALIDQVHSPLAVRSSSRLEDALFRPFAGVYATKMTPNNQPDPALRFRRLVEAIKFVYASTFFKAARSYIRSTDEDPRQERMAVIIQEVVGARHGDRYYPDVSGVCRSYNFYPLGRTRPEDGVVDLALGLGKTIVDGGVTWCYSPARPQAPPPFGSVKELMKNTQTKFWAVNMGRPREVDPTAEEEYLVQADLAAAEYDGTLPHVASTYDAASDRLVLGTAGRGPRAINFAPLLELKRYPLNDIIRRMLSACERALDGPVEIEFALTFPHPGGADTARVGFLQVRPMVVSEERVEITEQELRRPDLVTASRRVMGNGVNRSVCDVVYVKPESFDASLTPRIAAQLEQFNTPLLAEGRPYLLIGFGRWGSSDPWLGIPAKWGQICGARVIIEATLPNMIVELSQGSHFFHNISSFQVSYFSVDHQRGPGIDWAWLDARPRVAETDLVRHVRLEEPLLVKVDGRTGRGAVWQRA
ncbi:MAG: PEP/pyruvate-binding domain-containing protein [Planctomycetota bacterium]|nr:PEP/pyruvate-binding domain-containing protein [Planctomycetota bacterium]